MRSGPSSAPGGCSSFLDHPKSSVLLLLLLFSILAMYCLLMLRSLSLLNDNSLQTSANFRPTIDHIFILKSFFYRRIEISDQLFTNVVITLFNAEKHINPATFIPECLFEISGGDEWRQNALIEELYPGYPDFPCRLSVFRFMCHSVPAFPYGPGFKMGLRLRRSTTMEIPVEMANVRPRGLVVCPGRAFAFEQWHLFITAMELNRIHGVDLVVAHILSIRVPIFDLFELYQRDGLLEIRQNLQMPRTLGTLTYEPNTESLWSNIIPDFLDCLYEFRDSAQFISFPDWDDLLVSGDPPFAPLLPILQKFAKIYPYAGAFIPKRFPGNMIGLDEMNARNMSIYQIWSEGIRVSLRAADANPISKVIVRPSMVSSVELHGAFKLEWEKYEEMKIPADQMYFIHARDYRHIRSDPLGPSVADQLNSSFSSFLARHGLSSPDSSPLFQSLPHRELFLPTLLDCSSRIKTFVEGSKSSKCFNLAHCWHFMPPIFELLSVEQGNLCINAQPEWESILWMSRSLRVLIHQPKNSPQNFLFTKGKCLI